MRAGIDFQVTPEDRRRLKQIIGDRNSPQKYVARAHVILATAEGCGTLEVMRRSGLPKPVVWRWQERFMREGVDGLLRDKTRPPGKAPMAADIKRIVDLTLAAPPGETTHWTGRAMAEATGVSLRSVQRIWTAHGLAPQRVRTFKLSKDKRFVEKFAEVVGLYIDPPAHAIVHSVDEKSQIQALDRTQPELPMKKGRAGTMTHDYKRRGTTTLFAPLDVLEGKVIGRCMQRHRHQIPWGDSARRSGRVRLRPTPSGDSHACYCRPSRSAELHSQRSWRDFRFHGTQSFKLVDQKGSGHGSMCPYPRTRTDAFTYRSATMDQAWALRRPQLNPARWGWG